MDDPNVTMEENIRLEEEKARRHGKVYNWETATYGKIWDNEDVHDLGSIETEFPAIVFNDTLTSEAAFSCEPTVSSLNNNEINFRISFDESDDEDCTALEFGRYTVLKEFNMAYWGFLTWAPRLLYSRIFQDFGFARFNTIITSLKALDDGFSSKNYDRRFLRALHPKWRSKVMAIEESKDLSSLALDELIGNLKVHEVVMEKDSEIYKGKKERVKNFKKFFRRKGKFVRQPREEKKSFRQRDDKKGKSDRKCFRCSDPNHLIGDCLKPNKDQKAFIKGCWSDNENETEDKTNDETCLMAQSSNKVTLESSHYSDNASTLDNDSTQNEYDNLCKISLKIINKNKILKTKREFLEKEILELNEKIKKLKRNKEVDIGC
ncbi:zf-CCHC domain-containing protein [Tanacetum coccineum]